jgi:hypothetical protein
VKDYRRRSSARSGQEIVNGVRNKVMILLHSHCLLMILVGEAKHWVGPEELMSSRLNGGQAGASMPQNGECIRLDDGGSSAHVPYVEEVWNYTA